MANLENSYYEMLEMMDIGSQSDKMFSEVKKLVDYELDMKKREDRIKKERLKLNWDRKMFEMTRSKRIREVNVQKTLVKKYKKKLTAMEKKQLCLQKQLMDKEEEAETQNAMNQALTAKERAANDQLQEVRKELIQCFEDSNGVIGVKRVGDIDEIAFHGAISGKLPVNRVREGAAKLSSYWQDRVGDPNWHPFKMVPVEEGSDDFKEIIDPEDCYVSTLRMHLGDEACELVITALKEMNEYNPSGRFPVQELWNFKENRRASLRECVARMDFQRKQKLKCNCKSKSKK